MIEKKFEAYLILNWKTGKMRVTQRKPKKVTPYEIPTRVLISAKVPELKIQTMSAEIEIPETKIGDIFLESI